MVKTMHEEPENDGDVSAYFPTPECGILRLRGVETDDGWRELVEIVQPEPGSVTRNGRVIDGDKRVITVMETPNGLGATQVYNSMVEPMIRVELDAARDRFEEAKAQGDVINAHSSAEYIEELKGDLAGVTEEPIDEL